MRIYAQIIGALCVLLSIVGGVVIAARFDIALGLTAGITSMPLGFIVLLLASIDERLEERNGSGKLPARGAPFRQSERTSLAPSYGEPLRMSEEEAQLGRVMMERGLKPK